MIRILVCGGRDYGSNQEEIEHLYRTLDAVRKAVGRPITIIHGAQRGADRLAGEWAKDRDIEVREFPADWEQYGKRAGFIRNSQMLNEGQPQAVIAFTGGRGTEMMIGLAEKAGIPVVRK